MIQVTDLHGRCKHVNAELIELVESTPDTQILLTNGHRLYVAEKPEEVVSRIIRYRQACLRRDYLESEDDTSCSVDEDAT